MQKTTSLHGKGKMMVAYILVGVAVAAVLLVIFISTRPDTFRYERSMLMAASPQSVFEEVNDFHRWESWNPWGKLDPAMKREYSGPDQGVGASYQWRGNSNVGEGKMTITDSKPGELVELRLEFLKPMKATNRAELTFIPEGSSTRVRWMMEGKNAFMGKAAGLVMNMDKMIGGKFEQGLGDLKAIVEAK